MRGLYIGRFQPPHYGHLRAIEWILNKVDFLIIGIGSAQFSHTWENPFTGGERLEMLWRMLSRRGLLERCMLTLIPDTLDRVHALWVATVKQYCPPFDVVFTNDPLSRRLFIEAGIRVEAIPFFEREKYNATRIRRLMLEGDEWKKYVPPEVAEFIESIGGVQRLREIFLRSDKPRA